MVLGALGCSNFSFLKKSPSSLIFASILLFAAVASPVVPPTLSSPPFSSSSVCIPGFFCRGKRKHVD